MHTHPDSSDARGARGPVLAHQSLLALLTMLTIRPWVTPVPLGMRRRERERENELVTKPSRGPKPRGSVQMSTANQLLDFLMVL